MCKVTVPDLHHMGDLLFRPGLTPSFIADALNHLRFRRDDWDQGWGWGDAANLERPLGRTLAAISCLYSAAPSGGTSDILSWGAGYFRAKIMGLIGGCRLHGSDKVNARTPSGYQQGPTDLFMPFFYKLTVPQRAATLLHEARHADGVSHTAGIKDWRWEDNGAWRWSVCWLAWYIKDGSPTSPPMKEKAAQKANFIIDKRFVHPPPFYIKVA